MSDLAEKYQELEERLRRLEAEMAVRNLIARYGMAADCGDVEIAMACHTSDCVYTVSAPSAGRDEFSDESDLVLEGRVAVGNMLLSDLHQSLLPNCAHTVGSVTVVVTGSSAQATGYSRLYRLAEEGGNIELMRLAINEWHFVCEDQQWLIQSRESRVLGATQAQRLLKQATYKV